MRAWLLGGLCWGSIALAGPDALLVTQEIALERGQIITYTGVQRYPVGGVGEIEKLLARLERPAQNAKWIRDAQRGWVAIERVGYSFDGAAAKAAYQAALQEGRKEFRLPVFYSYSQKSPTIQDYYRLGVRELLSEGVTNFAGSSRNRIFNIQLATERLHERWIAPDEVFSWYKTVGDVTAKNGFREAFVIVGDRTETGVGGGVCQTSTTLFRAAFFAGLPIVERRPHSYQVSYYRPTGLDAAVYTPYQDFRFKNDTPGYLLLLTQIRGTTLTYSLLGTRDRSVQWKGPVISNRIAAPPTRYIEDSSLKPGQRKQVDFAADGATVSVSRTITYRDGRAAKTETIGSRYRPWAAVYLVGPTPKPATMPVVPAPPPAVNPPSN